MAIRRMSMSIESALQAVPLMGAAVRGLCSSAGLPESETYRLELCVVEAVTNCVKYAYENSSKNEVEIIVSYYQQRILFEIYDTGKTLSLRNKPTLDFDPDDPENLPEGGMGLFIIYEVMDSVTYTVSEGKKILSMTKFL